MQNNYLFFRSTVNFIGGHPLVDLKCWCYFIILRLYMESFIDQDKIFIILSTRRVKYLQQQTDHMAKNKKRFIQKIQTQPEPAKHSISIPNLNNNQESNQIKRVNNFDPVSTQLVYDQKLQHPLPLKQEKKQLVLSEYPQQHLPAKQQQLQPNPQKYIQTQVKKQIQIQSYQQENIQKIKIQIWNELPIYSKYLKQFVALYQAKEQNWECQWCIQTKKLIIDMEKAHNLFPEEGFLQQKRLQDIVSDLTKIKNNRKLNKFLGIVSVDLQKKTNIVIVIHHFIEKQEQESKMKQGHQNYRQKNQNSKDKRLLRDLIKNIFWQYAKFIHYSQSSTIKNWFLLFDEDTFKFRINNRDSVDSQIKNQIQLQLLSYEPILCICLFKKQVLQELMREKNPKYPFLDLIQLIKKIKNREKDSMQQNRQINPKIFQFTNKCEQQQFNHMINEILALQMQLVNYSVWVRIQKFMECPFFWEAKTRILQILQFKQIFAQQNNLQYDRIMKNYQLELKREKKKSVLDVKDIKGYILANSNHKTAQLLLIFNGIVQKQANSDPRLSKQRPIPYITQEFKTVDFIWSSAKKQQRFGFRNIKQKRYQNQHPVHLYDHLRAIRNFCAHSRITLEEINQSRQQKLGIIQEHYPTIFIFISKWRPLIELKLLNDKESGRKQLSIKQIFVKVLSELFPGEPGKKQMIQERIKCLKSIKELQQYIYKEDQKIIQQNTSINQKMTENKSLKVEDQELITCRVCQQIDKIENQEDFWSALSKYSDQNFQILFTEHSNQGCAWLNSQTVQKMIEQNIKNANDRINKILKIRNKQQYISTMFLYNVLSKYPNLIQDIRRTRYIWEKQAQIALIKRKYQQKKAIQLQKIEAQRQKQRQRQRQRQREKQREKQRQQEKKQQKRFEDEQRIKKEQKRSRQHKKKQVNSYKNQDNKKVGRKNNHRQEQYFQKKSKQKKKKPKYQQKK